MVTGIDLLSVSLIHKLDFKYKSKYKINIYRDYEIYNINYFCGNNGINLYLIEKQYV